MQRERAHAERAHAELELSIECKSALELDLEQLLAAPDPLMLEFAGYVSSRPAELSREESLQAENVAGSESDCTYTPHPKKPRSKKKPRHPFGRSRAGDSKTLFKFRKPQQKHNVPRPGMHCTCGTSCAHALPPMHNRPLTLVLYPTPPYRSLRFVHALFWLMRI